MMRISRVSWLLLLPVLSGCIPVPHTSERFPAMQGRVVDARTHEPVSDAIVSVRGHPGTGIRTAKNGSFQLSERRNYHLGVTVGVCGQDWPKGSSWEKWLDVSHPGYESREVNAAELIISSRARGKPYALRDLEVAPQSLEKHF